MQQQPNTSIPCSEDTHNYKSMLAAMCLLIESLTVSVKRNLTGQEGHAHGVPKIGPHGA